MAVLPVSLEPEKEYWLSVNSSRHTNFRSAVGEPAEPFEIAFRTAALPDGYEPPAAHELSAESTAELLRLLNDNYSYLHVREADWDAEFSDHELASAASPRGFARRAAEALGAADDPHIRVSLDEKTWSTRTNIAEPNADLDLLAELVPGYEQRSQAVWTGSFEDGVGYLSITSWDSQLDGTEKALKRALRELGDAPALIIDVRLNGGGDEGLAARFAGHFVDEPATYAKHRWRDPLAEGGFGPVQERVLTPAGRKAFEGRVAVLTGPLVTSSCEAFLLMMRQVPGAVLVGDRSFGSSGNPRTYPLPNGVSVSLPGWQAMRPDGSIFEGEGIKPDVLVEWTAGTTDPVLDAALTELRGGGRR